MTALGGMYGGGAFGCGPLIEQTFGLVVDEMDEAKQTDSFLTRIRKALKDGENDEVLALLEGRDVKVTIDSDEQTLLHLAAAYGNAFITDHLVKCGCIVDATDKHEITPLTLAVFFCHAEVMKILIDAGADLCKTDSKGICPIFYITMGGATEIIQVFKYTVANKKVCKEKVKKIFNHPYSNNWNHKKFFKFCSLYLRRNPVDKFYFTFCAAVITSGVKFFTEISSTMQMIFYYSGANINDNHQNGNTALHMAAESLNYVAINWLLDRGADVNARDIFGRTPLHHALYSNPGSLYLYETVELLIRNGADLHAISFGGETILQVAGKISTSVEGILRELTLLEDRGKPLNAQDLSIIESDSRINCYYRLCKAMVQQSKQYTILDNTTLFDLLSKNIQTLTAYAKNKKFRKKFTRLKKIDDFSMIAEHYLSEFIKCVNLLNITEQATVVLSETLPFLDYVVITQIIQYFSPDDLRLLAESNSMTTK